MYPLTELTMTPEGTYTVNPGASLVATGHFTQWFGQEANLQNDVEHATRRPSTALTRRGTR